MAKLVVISEKMKDRAFELSEERLTVGRLPDNRIHLEDSTVSSHHAELFRKGDEYVVRDLNSTNGTRVNGQRVVEMRLSHGDSILFGNLQLQYFSSSQKAQPLPTPLKKTIDLSGINPGTTTRPTAYGSSSPFAKKRPSRSLKILFQMIIIILGLLAIGLLVFVIQRLLTT